MSIVNVIGRNNIEIRAAHSPKVTRLGQLLRDSFITTTSPIVPDAANVAFANLKEPERFAESCWQDFQVLAIQNVIKGMLFVVEKHDLCTKPIPGTLAADARRAFHGSTGARNVGAFRSMRGDYVIEQ